MTRNCFALNPLANVIPTQIAKKCLNLKPATKATLAQIAKIGRALPMSGWITIKNAGGKIIKKLKKIFLAAAALREEKKLASAKITATLLISEGWILNTPKSIQRTEPRTGSAIRKIIKSKISDKM